MEDTTIRLLKAYLPNLEMPDNSDLNQQKFLQKQAKHYTLLNRKLYRCNFDTYQHRLVLTKSEAIEALYTAHQHPLGGHLAYSNTLNKLSSKYYWPSMVSDVTVYVKECPRCQRHGRKTLNERLHPVAVLHVPFEQIAIDVKHVSTSRGGYRYVIAAIDYLTKYVEARAVRFQTASEIALFLYEEIICRHGCPRVIITDNGKPMISELVYQVCLQFGVRHNTISPYNSSANGLIERFNRTFDQIMQKRTPEEKLDWHYYLPSMLFAYRSMQQATTKETPFYLLYGYQPRTPFDSKKLDKPTDLTFEDMLKQRTNKQINTLQLIRKNAIKRIETSQKSQKEAIDKKLLQSKKLLKPGFSVGDIVERYRDYRGTSWSGKLEDLWEGLYVVSEDLKKGSYVIQRKKKDGGTEIRIVHGNRLRIYKIPNVGWKLHENYKKTVIDEELDHSLKIYKTTQEMQIQGRSTKDINSRLGPQPVLVEVNSDNETIISFEEDDEVSANEEINEEVVEKQDEFNFLNLLDIEPVKPYDSVTKEKINNYNAMVIAEEVRADIWEYESRMKDIAEHKKRNGELINRMAMNIIKVCHMQLPMPQNKNEYGRYLHLRGFYISNLAGDTKKAGRTLAIKNQIKRIDDYECYEWFAGIPKQV
jgi:transposase InsO family protein